MASNAKILHEIAENLNLTFRKKDCLIYGYYQNYLFLIMGSSFSDSRQHVNILFCAKSERQTTLQTILPKGCSLQTVKYKSSIYMPIKGSHQLNVESIIGFLNRLTTFLAANDFRNCDELGMEGIPEIYTVKGEYAFLTVASAECIQNALIDSKKADAAKKENFIVGMLGACFWAVLASVLVFLVARLGYISSLTTALLGAGLVLGYKWKGIRLSIISSVFCIAMSAIYSYLVFRLDMAMSIAASTDLDFMHSFLHAKEIMQIADAMGSYYHNCILMTGAAVVGTIVVAIHELSTQKKQFSIVKIG